MSYCIQNENIKEVPHAKYLGVTIDEHLTWNEHVRQVTTKANNVKNFLHALLTSKPPVTKVW